MLPEDMAKRMVKEKDVLIKAGIIGESPSYKITLDVKLRGKQICLRLFFDKPEGFESFLAYMKDIKHIEGKGFLILGKEQIPTKNVYFQEPIPIIAILVKKEE